MGERICFRCDWMGGGQGTTCPRCRAPLYRVPETPAPHGIIQAPRPQPEPLGGRVSGSHIEMTHDDEGVPAAVPVALRRRGWVIAGGAFTVAAVWIVATGGFARTLAPIASGPALAVTTPQVDEPPPVNPADASAEEVALGFVEAFAAFDAQKAMTYVSDEADLTGVIDSQVPANAEGLSLMLSRLEAVGYKQTVISCEAAAFGSDTSVACVFDFHSLRSDQIGRGPFSGSFFVFTVRDGAIVRASLRWNVDEFVPQMWEPFEKWISSMYPKDATVMYLDPKDAALLYVDGTLLRHVRLSRESIRLWERHTREYVQEVKQGTA